MRRSQAAVALIAVALVLAAVALMVEAGRRIYHSIGPSKAVAAADGSLYVLSHGRLHVFAPDGTRRESIALESIGLTRTPSDLALHRDGRAVLADPDTSYLQRCRLPAGPCEALDLGLHRVDLQKVVPLNSVKVAIDDDAGRYYVSDNAGHQLVIADFGGKVLARTRRGIVWYPNHLFVSAPGALSVVDTNHHRIATFDVAGDGFGLARAVAADASAVTRPGRRWPFDAVRLAGGGTAVLIAADGMKDADLVLLDAAGRPARRLDLGSDSDPFDVEAWGSGLVVADATRYRLDALDLDGKPSGTFPPRDFALELERERATPALWRSIRLGSQVAVVLVPIVSILLLWRLGEPITNKPAPWRAPAATSAAGTGTLTCDPAYLARQRKRLLVATACMAVACAAMVALLAWRAPGADGVPWRRLWPFLAPLAVALAPLPLSWLQLRRSHGRLRLVSEPAKLEMVVPRLAGAARHLCVEWRDVYWDGRTLLAGATVVFVRTAQGGDMFARDAFERLILARIPSPNWVKPQRLWAVALRRRNPVAIAFAALLAFLALWAIVRAARLL